MANLIPGKAVDVVDSAMSKLGLGPSTDSKESSKGCVTLPSKPDPSGARMQAVHLEGKQSIRVCDTAKPGITDETDAIVRITSAAICGTDLHIYLGNVPGMKSHQVIGHEGMGVVESVGSRVSRFKPGDRVVVSCQIACGECYWCKDQKNFSCCDRTNLSTTQDKMMGAHTAGIVGFSEMNSGLQGTQAEFIRVPIADVNLLKVPPQQELPDDKVLFLSDILCTSWFGTELAKVSPNDVVAIWGCGPVGLLAAECSFAKGARRVIMVDNLKDRLDFAKRILPKIETVDFSKDSTSCAGEKQVLELCKNETAKAPDCCIECVGMHYAHSFIHRAEMAVGMETDTPEALNAAIFACRKGGRVAAIGAYVGFTNHFNIGTLMEKNITLASGQVPVQRYWNELLDMIRQGKIHPEKIITHRMKLSEAPKAFKMFNDKTDGCVKVVLTPDTAGTAPEAAKTS